MQAHGHTVARENNPVWQEYIRTYLLSGSATIVARRGTTTGLSKQTTAELQRLPVLGSARGFQLRQVQPG